MYLLKAKHLKKSYKDSTKNLEVLTDVNLSVKSKKIVALTGESGCGKSTLLHILGTLDSPDSGSLEFKERPISPKDNKELLSKDIGFVFQSHYLLSDFTATENVAIPIFLQNNNIYKSKNKAKEILKRIGMDKRADSYPNQLSGGEAQRVAVARAIANEPSLILADEPTGNLDPRNSEEVLKLFMLLNKNFGTTFIITTHNMQIAKLVDSHYILRNGILIK